MNLHCTGGLKIERAGKELESDPQVGPFHDIAHLAPRGPRSRRWAMQLRFLALSLYVSTAVGFSHPLLQRSTAFATLPSKLASVARAPAPVADEEFTSSQQLRAEVESPFSQVRLFVLPALTAAAAIATYFGGTALLAEAAGLREANPTALRISQWIWAPGTLGFLAARAPGTGGSVEAHRVRWQAGIAARSAARGIDEHRPTRPDC